MSDKAEIFGFGQFRVDILRRSLEREGQPVALSGKAFEILIVLLEQRGEVVDKDALMRQVWPDTAVEENNITVAISALRKALGETPASPKWIVTIPGRGYSFVGGVRCDPPTAETSPPIAQTTAPPSLRRSQTVYLFIAGALLVALSAYGLIAWRTPNWFAPKPLRSVAILPFGVLNQDSKNDYLGLGLTDALITRLGNTQLVVRPLATVSRFAERDPIQSGRDLRVEAVVEGNVQTVDNRIRVSVRLLRVRDGKPLWAQTFDVASDNAFTLEDSIAERVASSLSGALTGRQQSALNKRPTANASAYGNYLRGRYYAQKYTEDGFRKALNYLQSATDSDPAYALAYSGLADNYYDASNLVFPPSEAMPRAKAAAQRAVELDPSLAAAHVSLGLIASKYDWNWDVAEREFQAALAIDPKLATAHLWFGVYRAQLGDFDRAISELRRAQELDPLSSEINCYLGIVLYWAKRYDDSINQVRQAITFDPTFVPNHVSLCWALDAKGDTKAALDACKHASELGGNAWTTLALARAQALAGDHVTAAATMASLAKQAEQFVSGYDRAAVYAALGRPDDAFAALGEAYQSRAEWMAYLKVDPQMDALRRDPRYTTLLKRLGLLG
jgi:DNA-binding winged helix-turn-helix (wHTH) protein/TolB-like protein/Tfp pilus assembly protein PilF